MDNQLVALTIDQWRDIQRERRTAAQQYVPYDQPHTVQARNRQLLRITSDTPDEVTGYYPAVWLQSDTTDQSHDEQSVVWAWSINGDALEDNYFEGDHVGAWEDTPVFRGSVIPDNHPDIVRLVTNVCPQGDTSEDQYSVGEDIVISTEGGQAVIATEYNVQATPLRVKAVVIWKDTDFSSSSGDNFGFYLVINDVTYSGAPEYMVTFMGPGASVTKEMEWTLPTVATGPSEIVLWAYRVSGSRSLTVDAASRIIINGATAGLKVEYRQIIISGAFVGNKVCVINPNDCCVDDEASDTSSDLIVSCCSVPIPAARSFDLTGTEVHKPGWFSAGFGYWVNYDYLIDRIKDELNKEHVLNYAGTITDTRVRCYYEKSIAIPDAKAYSYFGFTPDEETVGDTVYMPTFWIRLRFLISERWTGEQSPFFDWNLVGGSPVGWINAPEYQAHCSLSIDYFTEGGVWSGLIDLGDQWTPHYSKEFYLTQDEGVLPPGGYATVSTLPDPGTSCAGACKLWSLQNLATKVINHPWLVSVESV